MNSIDIMKGKARANCGFNGDAFSFTPYLSSVCWANTDGSFSFAHTDILTNEIVGFSEQEFAAHLNRHPEAVIKGYNKLHIQPVTD